MRRSLAVSILSLIALTPLLDNDEALARAGRAGSSGSPVSRTYSAPRGPVTSARPSPPVVREPALPPSGAGSGALGFLAGGLLGGFLFGARGTGMGLLDLLVLAFLAYLALRLLRARAEQSAAMSAPLSDGHARSGAPLEPVRPLERTSDHGDLIATASDMFVKLQAAWGARDMKPIAALLTPEMQASAQRDCDQSAAQGRIYRIEDVSVGVTEVVETWQDSGQDYATVRIDARMIDYIVDEKTGQVVEGKPGEPVSIEEFWIFRRPSWAKGWRLSAIQQPVPSVN